MAFVAIWQPPNSSSGIASPVDRVRQRCSTAYRSPHASCGRDLVQIDAGLPGDIQGCSDAAVSYSVAPDLKGDVLRELSDDPEH
jgi:hypothetical protein